MNAPRFLSLSLGIALFATAVPFAQAANHTWSGGQSDTWDFKSSSFPFLTNWNLPPFIPGSGDNVFFIIPTPNAVVDLNGNRTVQAVFFDGVTNYSLLATTNIQSLTLNTGNITAAGTATHSLSCLVDLGAAATWDINNPLLKANRAIRGAFSLTKTGTGKLLLRADNTYSGGTTVSAGILQIGTITGEGSIVGNVTNNASLEFGRPDQLVYGGIISGSGGVTQLGAGTLILTGTNTYSGGSIITAGTLQVGNNGTSGQITGDITNNSSLVFNRSNGGNLDGIISGTGSLTKNGAGTLTLFKESTFSGGTTISAGTLKLDGGIVGGGVAGNITNNATLLFSRTADYTFGGIISGSGTVSQESGIVKLTGTNIYSGGTTISAGTLQVGNGGTSGAITGNVTNNDELKFDRSNNLSYGDVVSGSGSLTKNGAGRLTLTATNTYSGGTTISAGTLRLGSGGANGAITGNVTNDATLEFNRSNDLEFGGIISGTGSLTKNGGGMLTLTGANSYSGGTTINTGTLRANNVSGSATGTGGVTVNNAATLDGTGNLAGATLVNLGGTVAPGTSVGQLMVDAVTFESGSAFDIELSGNGGVPGTDFDQLVVSGTATLNGGTLNLSNLGGFTLTNATSLTILDAGTLNGTFDTVIFPDSDPRWRVTYSTSPGKVLVEGPMDFTAPNATAITPVTASPSNATSIQFDVTFNEDVFNFDAFADLTVGATDTATATGANFSGAGSTYTVTLTGVSGDGTLTLAVDSTSNVEDLSGNGIVASVTSSAVTIDNTGPSATVITPASTAANTSIEFAVTFNESVTGFNDIDDFDLATSGTANYTGTNISGSGANYTITLSGITGDGSVNFGVDDGGGMVDAAGNSLLSSVTNMVTIDNTAPNTTVITPVTSSPTNATTLDFDVTFDEAVVNFDSFADLVVGATNSATATGASFSGSDASYTVTLTGVSGDGDLTLTANTGSDIEDTAGNALASSVTSAAITIDNQGPLPTSIATSASSPTNANSAEYDFTFDEPTINFDSLADLQVSGGPTATGAIFSGSGTSYTVTLTGLAGDGTLNLSFSFPSDISDSLGNTLAGSAGNASIIIDNTAPDATVITPVTASPSNATTGIQFDVTFDETVVNFDSFNDLVVGSTSTATATGASFSGSGASYTVTLTGVSGDGDLTLNVDTGSDVEDTAGNALASSVTSDAITIDNTAPDATVITPVTASPSNATSIQFDVTFDETVVNFDSFNDLVVGATSTATATGASFSGSGASYTVTLTGVSGDGDLTLNVDTGSDVEDTAGNALASSVTSAAITIENTGPNATAITATGATTFTTIDFDVTFDESVVNFDAFPDLVVGTTATLAVTGANFSGSGANYTVTLTGVTGIGTLTLAADTGSDIADPVGNALVSSVTSDPINFPDRTPITWITPGPTVDDWLVPGNWDLNRVPNLTDDVFINNGGNAGLPFTTPVIGIGDLNVGTNGGSGTLESNSLASIANLTIGEGGGTGEASLSLGSSTPVVNGNADIGIDGGNGMLQLWRRLQLNGDLNIGVTRSGALPSTGLVDADEKDLTGTGANMVYIGRSQAAGSANGTYATGGRLLSFAEGYIGRVDGSGDATGALVAPINSPNAFTDLYIGYNDGTGMATATFDVPGSNPEISGIQHLHVGTSTGTSAGDTIARFNLDSGMQIPTLTIGNHQGVGTMDASITLIIDGTIRDSNIFRGYSAIDVDNAVLDGEIVANFQFIPPAGTHSFELINSTLPDGITGTPIFSVTNLNSGFTVDSFGVVTDSGVEKVILQISGTPIDSSWINSGTGVSAGDWFTGANWSTNIVPDGSEPADVNNGGEANIDIANAGGNLAEAYSLAIGTDENTGSVTLDGAELNLIGELAVGSSRFPGSGSGASNGILTLFNGANLTTGEPVEGNHTLGGVYNATVPTSSTAVLSLADSTMEFNETLDFGMMKSTTAPANVNVSLILDNSTLNFAKIDSGIKTVEPQASGNRTLIVNISNGSRFEGRFFELEGQFVAAAGTSGIDILNLNIADSTFNAEDIYFMENIVATGPSSHAEMTADIDITDSAVNSEYLELVYNAETRAAGATIATNVDFVMSRSTLNLEKSFLCVGSIDSSGVGAVGTLRGTLTIQDNSQVNALGQLELADVDAFGGAFADAEHTLNLTDSSMDFKSDFEVGYDSEAQSSSRVRNIFTLNATDSTLNAGDELRMASDVSYSGGSVMECDITLNLLRSSFAIGTVARFGELSFTAPQVAGNFSRANVHLTNSWMTVGGDALASVGTAESDFDLDRGFLDVAGNMTLESGTQFDLNLAGATRATTANVEAGGTLYSGVDVGGALTINGGDLTISVENGPLTEPAYVLFNYGSLTGTFTNVLDIPSGYTIDYAHSGGTAIALVTGSTPPTVVSVTPSTLGPFPSIVAGSFSLEIVFSEPVLNFDALADLVITQISVTSTVSLGSAGITVDQDNVTYTVPLNFTTPSVTSGSATGSMSFAVSASSDVTNASGTSLIGSVNSAPVVFAAVPYDYWIAQFFPNETDPSIIAFNADPNNDTWANGMMFVLASSPSNHFPDMLPTQAMDDTYYIFEFARSDNAIDLNPAVEHGTNLMDWTLAIDGQDGVVIEVEDDGFGTDFRGDGIDKVTVKIPHNGADRIFGQLVVGE